MILEAKNQRFDNFSVQDFVTTKQLLKVLEKKNEFRNDLIRIFKLDESKIDVIKIGNAKFLLDSIFQLDSQSEKIDITSKVKNIHLKKMLDEEKAIFEVFAITNDFILKENLSDILLVESRYSSKSDILDYYSFSKFANYCRDNGFEDLINSIKDYLNSKNANNEEEKKLRLLYRHEDKKFYLRAITSSQDYKDFGINFSVFVALITLGKYVEVSKNEIYINSYLVDDSNIYISFALKNEVKVNNNISLEFNLILENDEIKRNAVSFNGIFKLKYKDNNNVSEIYLKPRGIKKDDIDYPVDLLTYQHRGSVEKVFERIEELPELIEFFIKQVSEDAKKISSIKSPDDIRKFISNKVKYSKKVEFQIYKKVIYNKLMSISVDNTFRLFELLREVEDLFEHNDIISRNFWRTKLYESLIERE